MIGHADVMRIGLQAREIFKSSAGRYLSRSMTLEITGQYSLP